MTTFKCKSLGIKCDFEVRANNRNELVKIIALHANQTHRLRAASPNVLFFLSQIGKNIIDIKLLK